MSQPSLPLSASQGHWLVATVFVTLVPHAEHLPAWLSAICGLLLLWRIEVDRGRCRAPARWLLIIIAAAAVVAVAVQYRHVMGKDPGLAVLAAFACLKLLESASVRDGRSAVLLCFFLQMGQFLNGQEIPVAVLTLMGIILALASLAALEGYATPRSLLKRSLWLLLASLPFMVTLFVLFPRLQGPLWGLPHDAFSGMTGLSDTMRPGSIGRLVQSGGIAFRARFEGLPPPPQERYWRGPVLSVFDGMTWKPGFSGLTREMPHDASGPAYRYRLTLEPHNLHWILALDFPRHEGRTTRYSTDLQLVSITPVRERRRYDLEAFPAAVAGRQAAPHALQRHLKLPAGSNPRMVSLGRDVAERLTSPLDRVGALIDAFRRQNLQYTLTPPRLGSHAADEFFFDSRQGFCEHFASAFAIAARAAGVPTRVVTGYQGGEVNPHDGTLVVRQSDAHAWVEIWTASGGWQRIDPTAASAPTRIDSGIAGALPDSDILPLFMQPRMAWLRALQWRWEALGNSWNQWVIGYNDERQQDFLRGLGFEFSGMGELLTAAGAVGGLLMLGLLAWSMRAPRRADRVDRLWDRFCGKLAGAGTERPQWMGPIEFARLAAAKHPGAAGPIEAIARRYAALRYGRGQAAPGALNGLAEDIKRLTLK